MRVIQVAIREFTSTALTKGFIIGALVFPALIFSAMPLVVKLIQKAEKAAPVVTGRMVLVDQTDSLGSLADHIETRLRVEESDVAPVDPSRAAEVASGGEPDPELAQRALAAATGKRSVITLERAASDADVGALREDLREAYTDTMTDEVLAIAVVSPSALAEGDEGFGGFELIHRRKLDDRVVDRMSSSVVESVRDLRYEGAGLDRDRLASLRRVTSEVREVTETGAVQDSTTKLGVILPFVLLILLIMSAMTGGQYLLTTTVEEKSSRVVELLLSAVSPMQLMFGKILGQMAVGLALLVIYTGLGVAAATYFSLASGLVTPLTLALLGAYFFLAYIMIASFMAAIGSAVNEMREAQSMMMPIMMLIMVPYMLVFPISRDPNSVLAMTLSFLPPISPFVMVIRTGSTSPPALWEHAVAIAIATIGAYVAVWFAAKVFRVGLLMYGKPPNLKTLIRWVRLA